MVDGSAVCVTYDFISLQHYRLSLTKMFDCYPVSHECIQAHTLYSKYIPLNPAGNHAKNCICSIQRVQILYNLHLRYIYNVLE